MILKALLISHGDKRKKKKDTEMIPEFLHIEILNP